MMLLIQCYAQNYNSIIQQALAFIVCNYSGTPPYNCPICTTTLLLLAIIPRARIGSESIAHSAAIDSEPM